MNGVISVKESSIIDRKPIITCAGELEVFASLEDSLTFALPQDSCEWRRSLGRPVRNVHIGVKFTPFSPEALPRENQWDLIRHPLFHIYWTECLDVDVYKTNVRDDIENWLKELNARNITDWLIVVVETFDIKRANKLLPRTTVLDKIRADFAPKQGDRCISVLNPSRQENRTADSWRGLILRVRYLILIAYARAVSRLEEHVRSQRERRNEPNWHFLTYFLLQEEYAQVLEMLGLHDESLVQYDELDALFSQFVVNASAGDAADWLKQFQKPLERWWGLILEGDDNGGGNLGKEPSLLELRAYLYSKQARMLLQTNRPWEMASRCLPFLHTCVRELSLLEVNAPVGAVNCWLFLAAMEVLHACERYNRTAPTDQVEAYSLHTADLWEYASRKLRQLGELCGLLPKEGGGETGPTSEQLHIVVSLSAGMGDNPGSPKQPSPTDKLKEALCSKDAFNRHYLELSELAMGTYKHVGRIRSARLVGRDLASFYQLLGETQKSAAFLNDALKTFQQENWHELTAQTHLELANCYLQAKDIRRYVKSCASVASSNEMDTITRCTHFDEMLKHIQNLEKLTVPFINTFKIVSINPKNDQTVMQDTFLHLEVEIECNLPRKIVCSDLKVSLDLKSEVNVTKPYNSLQRLKIHKYLDFRQDKQLGSASVICKSTPLKRADSLAKPKLNIDWTHCLRSTVSTIALTPGLNVVPVRWLANVEPGFYTLGYACVELGPLQFVSPPVCKIRFEVRKEEPNVRLDKTTNELLAGVPQSMLLTVTIGSYPVENGSTIKLKCSRGLTMQNKVNTALVQDLEISIEDGSPQSCTRHKLNIFCDLPAREHHVQVKCPWNEEILNVPLDFTSPLSANIRLHTAHKRKFIQIVVCGQCSTKVRLCKPALRSETAGVSFLDLNPALDEKNSTISSGSTISFMWEIKSTPKDRKAMKNEFFVEYSVSDEENKDNIMWRVFSHNFNINDYETLYLVQARVEPTKGSEFCRVGALCHLRLSIQPLVTSEPLEVSSLMYEVLAEQSVWAVCGRTAGVVSVSSDRTPQTVSLDVMPLSSGYLPLPLVRLSKYIPADKNTTTGALCHLRLSIQPLVTSDPLEVSSLMYEVLAEQSVWAVCGRTAGVVSVNSDRTPQTVSLDVMPLSSGYLPLPLVRLSKYIPADKNTTTDGHRKTDINAHPRLEPFSPGQVYNSSKGQQIHVLAAVNDTHAS